MNMECAFAIKVPCSVTGVGYLISEFHVPQLVLDVHKFGVLCSTTGVGYLSSEIHVSITVVGNFSLEFYVQELAGDILVL